MSQTAAQPRQLTETDPRSDASPMVDAIVIGSGFGGAVAAARLAQAGRSVFVVERGRRFSPADFPRGDQLSDGWLWNVGHGIYDIRRLDRMLSIQAAGWGGGSLVYANVFARPGRRGVRRPSLERRSRRSRPLLRPRRAHARGVACHRRPGHRRHPWPRDGARRPRCTNRSRRRHHPTQPRRQIHGRPRGDGHQPIRGVPARLLVLRRMCRRMHAGCEEQP